ncbi:MAG TPA: hypothetical protein VK669_12720, partial [Candidatus Limnocylindrales bacterium]|nr:hypothetical protein [Candidatus Limnocylindrales bacterium]
SKMKSVDAVGQLLEYQRELAEDELSCARGDIESARALLDACAASDDDEALARVRCERDALLVLIDSHYRDRDATSVAWMIAERIMPSLHERRLRTRALRLSAVRTELYARFPGSRSGLMRRVETFDRALHAAASEAAARRAEAESLVDIGVASVRHAEERAEDVAHYSRMLDELESAGARQLLFPPRTSLRATIAYEHRRRFGAGGALETPGASSAPNEARRDGDDRLEG